MSDSLKTKLKEFKTKINKKTTDYKCDVLLMWLENVTVESVLKQQFQTKTLRKLMRPDALAEERGGVTGAM